MMDTERTTSGETFWQRLSPRSLFVRALLILVVPVVLLQLLTAYVFFERHWDNVTRRMSSSLAGEISMIVEGYEARTANAREDYREEVLRLMGIEMRARQGKVNPDAGPIKPEFPEFESQLQRRLDRAFRVEKSGDGEMIFIDVQLDEGVLQLRTGIKRLASSTTTIFISWMTGTATLLLLVSIFFLRGQIRPIAALAEAAERFGKGQEVAGFRPRGSSEVRRAARAFLVMKERIRRHIATRVEMLAGISHDLRTPLSRMKLQLAMMGDGEEVRGLQADVASMEHMVQEYLDFARGEGREEATELSLKPWLEEIMSGYARQGAPVTLEVPQDTLVVLRRRAMTRCLGNLIENALRYGGDCRISTRALRNNLEIHVDDSGPGIAPENRVMAFRPFTRLEPSRNVETGGAGLGLTIARDIAVGHGGEIILSESPAGGLRATIRLPL